MHRFQIGGRFNGKYWYLYYKYRVFSIHIRSMHRFVYVTVKRRNRTMTEIFNLRREWIFHFTDIEFGRCKIISLRSGRR
jgi:hypothetical protein